MRSIILALAALTLATAANAAPNCTKGKPCGNACIAKTDTCHIASTPSATPKHCKDPKTHKFTKCSAPGAVPA